MAQWGQVPFFELERAEAKGGAELPMTDKKLSHQEQD
jgi:hypothetical protein